MKLAALCATCLLAGAALADDGRYQDYPVGSRATALGGAFVALSDDPSGLFYNPAGICDSRRLNVSVSASLYGVEKQSQGRIQLNTGSFSVASLNVIPGEAGLIKGFGPLDDRGTPLAFGFDLSVPSFRSYGTDATGAEGTSTRAQHSRVNDRTFVFAAGGGYRIDSRWNVGVALHYQLRLFDQTEDQLLSGAGADPAVGVYHAAASFETGNLVALLGVKYRPDGRWLFGASLGLPGFQLHSAGKVNVQDVASDPAQPPGSRTTVTVINEADSIKSQTNAPLMARVGVARVEPHRWTLSGQITAHAGTSYDRFSVAPAIAQRLRIQDHVDRRPVVNLNAGGEYLLNADYSIALGLFTDRSGAQPLQADASGLITPGTSHLTNVDLYGGTATFGVLGQHSISRLGMSISYGTGEDAALVDGASLTSAAYQRVSVRQLFLYFFLASTFRY